MARLGRETIEYYRGVRIWQRVWKDQEGRIVRRKPEFHALDYADEDIGKVKAYIDGWRSHHKQFSAVRFFKKIFGHLKNHWPG